MKANFCVTTSWDDGSIFDLRLAKLLKKYHIPATFYIPLKNAERPVLSPAQIKILAKDFEIGCHGMTHTSLTKLTNAADEIVSSKKNLEQIVGKEIVSFCYPQGKVNQTIKQLVGKAGFHCARTTQLFATTIGDMLLMPTTVHAYDHHPFVYPAAGSTRKLFYQLGMRGNLSTDWESLAYASLAYCLRNGGVFHLWGHAWEIDARNEWEKLERVLRVISEKTKKTDRLTNREVIEQQSQKKFAFYQSLNPQQYQTTYETPYYHKEQEFLNGFVTEFDKKKKTILDIGCGTGRVSALFTRASYEGIDFSSQFISFAKKRWKENNKTFTVAEYAAILKRKRKSDLILVWELFEDEPNPFAQIDRLKKQLASQGRIIFTMHNADNLVSQGAKFIKTEVMEKNFPYTCFTYEFVKKWAEEYAKKNGFRAQVSTFGLFPPVLKQVPGISSRQWGGTLIVVLDDHMI